MRHPRPSLTFSWRPPDAHHQPATHSPGHLSWGGTATRHIAASFPNWPGARPPGRHRQASSSQTLTFTYTPTLTRFTLRYLLEVEDESAAEADQAALVEAELLATDSLESRGITHKPLTVSAACLQDVKIKRRR